MSQPPRHNKVKHMIRGKYVEYPPAAPNTADHCAHTLVRISIPVYASKTLLPPGFELELEELLDKYSITRYKITTK